MRTSARFFGALLLRPRAYFSPRFGYFSFHRRCFARFFGQRCLYMMFTHGMLD